MHRAQYVVQRVHHLDAASSPRFAANRPQLDQPLERIRLVDGDTELLPGLELIETGGHAPGHQSVLVRLPGTGTILLPIDAVPFAEGFTRDAQDDGSDPDAEAIRADWEAHCRFPGEHGPCLPANEPARFARPNPAG